MLKKIIVSIFGVGAFFLNWAHILKDAGYAQVALLENVTTIQYTPPTISDRGRPDGRQGGAASRSSCFLTEDNATPLTALVPSTQITLNRVDDDTNAVYNDPDLFSYEAIFSLTTETHPSFWFYIPDVSDQELTLEFIIQNEQGYTLYQNKFANYGQAGGVVEVTLPETITGLVVDESYQWYFIAHCNEIETANGSPYVKGWIARTELDSAVQTQISSASDLEKASIYAENSVWHDTLAPLTELRLQDPENIDLQDTWIDLLNSVGLDAVADKPILDCCTFLN